MAFKVTVRPNGRDNPDGEAVKTTRSITGARLAAADEYLLAATDRLADDSLWAAKTIKLVRADLADLIAGAVTMRSWEGPEELEVLGVYVKVEHDGEAPTRAAQSANNKADAKGHRWLDSVRFGGKKCAGGCGVTVRKGVRAWYEAPNLYCESCGEQRAPTPLAVAA